MKEKNRKKKLFLLTGTNACASPFDADTAVGPSLPLLAVDSNSSDPSRTRRFPVATARAPVVVACAVVRRLPDERLADGDGGRGRGGQSGEERERGEEEGAGEHLFLVWFVCCGEESGGE